MGRFALDLLSGSLTTWPVIEAEFPEFHSVSIMARQLRIDFIGRIAEWINHLREPMPQLMDRVFGLMPKSQTGGRRD